MACFLYVILCFSSVVSTTVTPILKAIADEGTAESPFPGLASTQEMANGVVILEGPVDLKEPPSSPTGIVEQEDHKSLAVLAWPPNAVLSRLTDGAASTLDPAAWAVPREDGSLQTGWSTKGKPGIELKSKAGRICRVGGHATRSTAYQVAVK